MGKAIRLSEDMIGKKVRCVYKDNYYYPEAGMIGTIVEYDWQDKDISYKVQWPKGSTFGEDCWWVANKYIELVEDDETNSQEIPDMTNEEIWKMLEPKMDKNGFVGFNLWDGDTVYYEFDVINAVAIAYRSGYERCMKGRPFKFSDRKAKKEKKQSGHWEPVDSNNLPRNGTKVRYTRYNVYWEEKTDWKIGDCGHVLIFKGEKYSFGVCPDKTDSRHAWDWCNCPECLDMWVEDNE